MVKIVAEIGCNHMGDMGIARQMVTIAGRHCGADIVKFQKREIKELLNAQERAAAHPEPHNAYGANYGEHREALEFTLDEHRELAKHCRVEGVLYSSSVWDVTSAEGIAGLEPGVIKIPSAANLDWPMQRWLCENYPGEIHISTGMTTHSEIEEIVVFYEQHRRAVDVVLYAATSGYPVPFEDCYLNEISRLRASYGGRVKEIGYSGHHLGIALDVVAVALGATYLERHFTIDRTWKGTDHAASLEPSGLSRLVRDVRAVTAAMRDKPHEMAEIEQIQRDKLKKIDRLATRA